MLARRAVRLVTRPEAPGSARRIAELENRERELLSTRELPCVTRDGVEIEPFDEL